MNLIALIFLLAGNTMTFHINAAPPYIGYVEARCQDCIHVDMNTDVFELRFRINRGNNNSYYITVTNLGIPINNEVIYTVPLRIYYADWQFADANNCLLLEDVSGMVGDKKGNIVLVHYDGPMDALKVCMPPMLYLPVIMG